MTWVVAAYGATVLALLGYAAWIARRRREVERAIDAWSEVVDEADVEGAEHGDL